MKYLYVHVTDHAVRRPVSIQAFELFVLLNITNVSDIHIAKLSRYNLTEGFSLNYLPTEPFSCSSLTASTIFLAACSAFHRRSRSESSS